MSCGVIGVPGSAYEAAEQWGPRETTLRRVIIPREHNLRLVEAGDRLVKPRLASQSPCAEANRAEQAVDWGFKRRKLEGSQMEDRNGIGNH